MKVPKSIFREYDVRGLVDRELTPDFARALGRAFASVATDRLGRPPVIAVGRDNRPSGPALSQGVRTGIVEAGGTAVDVGTLPTPALYFAVFALGTDAVAGITLQVMGNLVDSSTPGAAGRTMRVADRALAFADPVLRKTRARA